jgi:hypothetical protein
MPDWPTISSLATAGGTLVLAVATFSSVRSANRAARTAERTLQVGLRPVLFPSRPQDPPQKLRWGDDHWGSLAGGRAIVEDADGIIYLAISLRNVGAGIAVLHGWRAGRGPGGVTGAARPELDGFRVQRRDLYVPAGDTSFWQAAIRDSDDPDRTTIREAIAGREAISVDLLYGDHEGGQRAVSRFSLTPRAPGEPDRLCAVIRHWNVDRPDPR